MGYKCPYCLHSFQKEDALVESSKNGVLFQHCPNPVIKEIGGKICGKRLPLNFFESIFSTAVGCIFNLRLNQLKTFHHLIQYPFLHY